MSERFVGRYEVKEKIGVGSAGTVYRGVDGKKIVALKLMSKDKVDEAALKRLKESAATLAQLRHPMVASFLDLFETDKAICVVTQLAPGSSLATQLKQGAWPDPRHIWHIARQILDALSLAHGRGIFHGGITPTNILIDDGENVTLTDFGLGDLVPSTRAPEFMAPEQLDGRPVDARTDLYQVGALVYLLVTGLAPFSGTRDEVVHLVRQQRPADPSALKPKIAWQLDWVIQRALSKDPMDRFGTAREFLDGLRLGLQETLGKPLPLPVIPAMPPEPAVAPAPKPAVAAESRPAAATPPKPAPAAALSLELEPVPIDEPKPAPAPPPAQAPKAAPAPVAATKPAPAAPLSLEPVPEAIAEPKPPSAAPATLAAKAKILASAVPPPAEKKPPVEDKRMRVLFVDDDERVLKGLEALFRQDYRVLTAKDGASALALARTENFQIVVSDQRMPGMTGVEVLREMRKISPHSVRMLLTGYSDLAAMVGSINEGEVFRFVKKPWDNDEIRATLADAAALAMKFTQVPARPAAPPATVPASVDAPAKPAAPAKPVAPAQPSAPAKPVSPPAPVAAGKPPAAAMPAAAPKTGAPQAGPSAAPSIRSAGSLLVIDPSGALGKGLERLVTGEATVHSATSVPQAAKLLQQLDVAAVIADMSAGKNDLVTLFKLLKSKRPQTLSILVSDQPDSEVVVELINQAQVHRLLGKPVNVRELRSHVSEALRRYAAFNQRTRPGIPSSDANRTRPAPAPATTKNPA